MQRAAPNYIVGIGASAGGLNAYKAFFDALRPDTGMAFVVVSHIHPAAHSQLVEILSRHTKMTVTLAISGMKLWADEVYVIPGDADLLVENGALKVISPRTRRNAQVDIFFSSLATAMGKHAIGVVLSGYGSDGTEGCRRIKAAGGLTFAQDTSAEVNGMPTSAQATACIDFVLPPDLISFELNKLTVKVSGK